MKREKFAGRTPGVLRTLGVAAVVLAAILVAGGFLAAQYGFFGGGTNAPSVPEDTMTRGLVGYWSMDEGTGSAAYDASGDGNDGTIYGAQWTKGKNAGALQFDGTDDYVDCGNDASLAVTSNPFTFEAWANTNTVASGYGWVVGKAGWNMGLTRYTNRWFFITYDNADKFKVAQGTNVVTGRWYHLVGVFDSDGYINLYVDGVFKAKTYVGATRGYSAQTYLGTPNGSDLYFNGKIDEVRIYNRALSAEEVRYHYNHGGPVAHWKFDEGSGTTIHDSSGNGHNGTLTP